MRKRYLLLALLTVLVAIMVTDVLANGSEVLLSFAEPMAENLGLEAPLHPVDENTPHADRQDRLDIAPGTTRRFSIVNAFGDLTIVGSDVDSIGVDFDVTVYADIWAQAAEYADEVSLVAQQKDGRTELLVREAAVRPDYVHRVSVDYRITAPRSLTIEILNEHGTVDVSDFEGKQSIEGSDFVRVITLDGDQLISNVAGQVKLTASGGEVKVENVRGQLSVSVSRGSAYLKDLTGPVFLHAVDSDAEVVRVGGDAEAEVYGGDLVVENAAGGLSINADGGDVTVRGIREDATIRTWDGDIDVSFALEAGGFDVQAVAEGGTIRVNDLPLEVHRDSETDDQSATGILGDGRFRIYLESHEEDITLGSE